MKKSLKQGKVLLDPRKCGFRCPGLWTLENKGETYIKNFLVGFGDVASLNSLMATGILTFSPSGIQSPCDEEGEKTLAGTCHIMQYAYYAIC